MFLRSRIFFKRNFITFLYKRKEDWRVTRISQGLVGDNVIYFGGVFEKLGK